MTVEIWKPIIGFEGQYEVSDLGRVRGCARLLADGRSWPQKLRKPTKDARGYVHLTLRRGLRTYKRWVHRLVLEAFVGPAPFGRQAAHKDGQSGNNRLTNLRWATRKSNNADKLRHGTQPMKLTPADRASIKARRARGEKLRAIAQDFNVSIQAVSIAARYT